MDSNKFNKSNRPYKTWSNVQNQQGQFSQFGGAKHSAQQSPLLPTPQVYQQKKKPQSIPLISQDDLDLMPNYINEINKEIKKRQLKLIEPYETEINAVNEIILSFIKENRRKVYGGYALNMLICEKNKSDAIYSPEDVPDIDFYSPEPLKDLIKICNLLHTKGFKRVSGREAQHKETYSIRVNNHLYCDISYMPRNIYSKMPFTDISGLYVTGPEFMFIDYLRITSDMIVSGWRLEKAYKRFFLLQKYYPLPYITNSIDFSPNPDKAIGDKINSLLSCIFDFATAKPLEESSLILIGFYAYNQLLKSSQIVGQQLPQAKKFKYLDVPYYEIISTQYRIDGLELIKLLKTKFAEIADDIHVIEHYPFFQFTGYFTEIFYSDTLICKLYDNNKKCIPYNPVSPDKYLSNRIFPGDKTKIALIGSVATIMLYGLVSVIAHRVNGNQVGKNLYYTFLSHLIEFRDYFLGTQQKTIYDRTLFQEFIVECKGIPITPEQEKLAVIEKKKSQGKKPIFTYDPSDELKADEIQWFFANSSGNPIKNIKNLKLTEQEPAIDPENEEPEDIQG